MILICGIPSESPVKLLTSRLNAMGEETVIFSQRQVLDMQLHWQWKNNKPQGELSISNCDYKLDAFKGVYLRLMDHHHLPEVKGESAEIVEHNNQLHERFGQWLEVCPATVVNKFSTMYSNASKPYQAQIIRRYGLLTPPTLITNQPDEVLRFRAAHGGRIIYKSLSGVRSIVKELTDTDLDRLPLIKHCPVQFQARLGGYDMRVHVIGNRTFATKITTTGTDYRYAHKDEGGHTELKASHIPAKVAEACVQVTKSLGLHFSGIDLRFTPDGKVYCFEVNPMPGYSYYEGNTGQPISQALAEYLVA
jgi:glutathione synthase/RimK-type ligase-like ATP-grasp enzyme